MSKIGKLNDRELDALVNFQIQTTGMDYRARAQKFADKIDELRKPLPICTLVRGGDNGAGDYYWRTERGWIHLGNCSGLPYTEDGGFTRGIPRFSKELPVSSYTIISQPGGSK